MKDDSLSPLKISCTNSDCANDLHCFRATRKMKIMNKQGACRYCGAELIDWPRMYRVDQNDISFTFSSLKREWIRHYFWEVDIDQRAINHARRKGRISLRAAAEKRIRISVGPAHHPMQGRQTPWQGNVLYYAQHATACCCRKCMNYWYGIPTDRDLTEGEIKYFASLIDLYVGDRMPDLDNESQKVTPIRAKSTRKYEPEVN